MAITPLMHRLVPKALVLAAIFLPVALLAPIALVAQSVTAIPTQQCVWHAGDNPAWAAPSLDDSAWQPSTQWKLQPGDAHMWVRCRADLSTLRDVDDPAIQVSLPATYQVFVNGKMVGSAGDLGSGHFSMDTIRSFPLPSPPPQPAIIALRITYRYLNIRSTALEIHAGEESALRDRRAGVIVAQSSSDLTVTISFGMIGVFGLVLLGLFLYDRSRRELLLLSIVCCSLAVIFLNLACSAALVDYSDAVYLVLWSAAAIIVGPARVWFFFVLARRRVPVLFWLLIGLATADPAAMGAMALVPASQALWVSLSRAGWAAAGSDIARIALESSPFVAFWPYARISRHMRPLAVLCIGWGAAIALFFSVRITALNIPGLPNLMPGWGNGSSEVQAITTLCVVTGLLGLLFREQRRIAEERAEMAGELRAASEIQRMLAPAVVDSTHGLQIEVAFRPMREVGGDFYLCRVLPDGRQRVLLGDVSGKGAAAAMTAALLLGGAERRDGDSPGKLLAHLNGVLHESRVPGFATCLCADFAPDGTVTLANAGHLAPYCRGEEIAVAADLPLGLKVEGDGAYGESRYELAPGEALTFLSDGVVEARDARGELLGFERMAALTPKPVAEIAETAQRWGQEDDITVLTITRMASKHPPADSIAGPALATS